MKDREFIRSNILIRAHVKGFTMPCCLLHVRFNDLFLSLCLVRPFIHLLQSLSLCGHVQLEGMEGSDHLSHGELDQLPFKLHRVAFSLLEARRLVVLRSDWKDKQWDRGKQKPNDKESVFLNSKDWQIPTLYTHAFSFQQISSCSDQYGLILRTKNSIKTGLRVLVVRPAECKL